MPQGDKRKYTDKQVRKAGHIAESYEARGVPEEEAEARAWATVNKDDGGGKKPGGSGRGKAGGHPEAHAGGEAGGKVGGKPGGKATGKASAARTPEERSASAKKAAATRKERKQG